ncbi:MAG TPA: hypothetical protein VFE62_21230 [Gemmataceae bacterium]|nr:hypothetical protein [Gemmataceae bacterium]
MHRQQASSIAIEKVLSFSYATKDYVGEDYVDSSDGNCFGIVLAKVASGSILSMGRFGVAHPLCATRIRTSRLLLERLAED